MFLASLTLHVLAVYTQQRRRGMDVLAMGTGPGWCGRQRFVAGASHRNIMLSTCEPRVGCSEKCSVCVFGRLGIAWNSKQPNTHKWRNIGVLRCVVALGVTTK